MELQPVGGRRRVSRTPQLHQSIIRPAIDHQPVSQFVNGLVVCTVYYQAIIFDHVVQNCSLFKIQSMCFVFLDMVNNFCFMYFVLFVTQVLFKRTMVDAIY